MATALGNSYSSTLLFFNPLLDIANLQAQYFSPLVIFTDTLTFLTTIDFSVYQNRKLALSYIQELYNFPPPLFTESFQPLDHLALPHQQTRFPSPGTYVDLGDPIVFAPLQNVIVALNYKDSEGPIEPARTAYYTAVNVLVALLDTGLPYFDRIEFETLYLLLWVLYPLPVACPATTPSTSPPQPLPDSVSTTPSTSLGSHPPPFRRSSLRYKR